MIYTKFEASASLWFSELMSVTAYFCIENKLSMLRHHVLWN
jgi:hypothetical protein